MSASTSIATSAGLFSGQSVDVGVEADLVQLLADSVVAVSTANAQNMAAAASLAALETAIASGATSISAATSQGTASLSTALTLALATLQAQGVSAGTVAQTAAAAAAGSATQAAASAALANVDSEITLRAQPGFRNQIINPRFTINQRNTPTLSNSGPTVYTFMADRWGFSSSNGGTRTVSVAALSASDLAQMGDESLESYINLTVSGTGSSTDFEMLAQRIENVRALSGKPVTVSFWARAPNANSFPVLGGSFSQHTGNATVSPAGASFITPPLSSSWSRFSFPVTIPSLANVNYSGVNDYTELDFYASAGPGLQAVSGGVGVQSTSILIAGVQVELGSYATPLEYRPRAAELALCQRYFQGPLQSSLAGYAVAGGPFGLSVPFIAMRGVPQVSNLATYGSNTGTLTWTAQPGPSYSIVGTATATGGCIINVTYSLSSEF